MERKAKGRIVYILSLIIPLGFLVLFFSIAGENKRILFNSDILYFPTLFKDLIIDGYPLQGWNIPGSPNFFPDMLMYFILMGITGKITISAFLFAFIQFLTILFLFNNLIFSSFPKISAYTISLGNLLLSLFFLIYLSNGDFYLSFHLVSNTYHLGAFVNCLIALLFSIRYIKTEKIINLFLLLITGILSIISDRLFLIMYFVPFLGALIIFLLKKENLKKLIFLSSTMFIMLAIGLILFDRITHNHTVNVAKAHFDYTLAGINMSWASLSSYIVWLIKRIHFFSVLFFISVTGLVLGFIYFFRSIKKFISGIKIDSESGMKHLLNTFFILFMIFVFFTPVVTGSFQGWDTIRYNIFVFYLGPLYFGIILTFFFNENKSLVTALKYSSVIVLISLSVYTGIFINRNKPLEGLKQYFSYYPEIASFTDKMADKYELKQGLTTYWNGKVGTNFSQKNIRLYTVYDESMIPYSLVGNDNWYYQTGKGKYDPPVFNFVIFNNPVSDSAVSILKERLGEIKASEVSETFSFFLFDEFIYTKDSYLPKPLK